MAKKMEDAEIKKECPSCGLGVALDATICEFCGWDFEEEDEWILQIEKLERELMLEKQKFEPGTVNHMIESTLRTPAFERVGPSQQVDEAPPEAVERTEEDKTRTEEETVEETPAEKPEPAPSPRAPTAPAPGTKVRRVRSVKGAAPTSPTSGGPRRPSPAKPEPRERPAEKKGMLSGIFSMETQAAPAGKEKPKKERAVRRTKK